MRNNNFTIEEFLDLQKSIKTKLHLRDACGGNVNEVKNIQEYFEKKGISVNFSPDKKYVYKLL